MKIDLKGAYGIVQQTRSATTPYCYVHGDRFGRPTKDHHIMIRDNVYFGLDEVRKPLLFIFQIKRAIQGNVRPVISHDRNRVLLVSDQDILL